MTEDDDPVTVDSQRGFSALSLEEHKLLRSLDRLNHRLQCKLHHSHKHNLFKQAMRYKYFVHFVLRPENATTKSMT